jgi:multicomponent Na+:H+ antiporter subunit E
VAKRVIDPKLPINPGIVAIKTDLKEDYKKLILANSITLTPGTITMDVQGDTLYIHWIDATTSDIQKASKEIAGSFEEVLLKL